MVSLEQFQPVLRPYQLDAAAHALEQPIGSRTLYAAPTGTGKGTIELAVLAAMRGTGRDAVILTPSLEVLRGYLERCGATATELSSGADKLAELGEQISVYTPVRYRNQVLRGERSTAEVFICDEAHHQTDGGEVSGLLFTLAPEATWVGFTATPFRGTPKGSAELEAAWGEPFVILTIPEAIEAGHCSMPLVKVKPLVDDDTIKVVNGQFVVSAVDKVVGSRLEELAAIAFEECKNAPTVLVVPSTDTAHLLVDMCRSRPVDAMLFVGQETSPTDRMIAYSACKAQAAVLVVINVLGEGVDLPWLRTMVDASPTMSPVVWMQRIGRIMRPGEVRPRYLCVCRNLERHAYLMQGSIPLRAIAQAQHAFDQPTDRAIARAFGIESLKRFKQIDVPLLGGARAAMWFVHEFDEEAAKAVEYVSILHPAKPEVITARRENLTNTDGTRAYGRWTRCTAPASLQGFATSTFRSSASDKQKDWWRKAARSRGLDTSAADTITGRQFAVLPVLIELKETLA